jgi:1,4-alpha-glucan branching enzyme
MSLSNEVRVTDCAEAVTNYSFPRTTIALPEGSWGEGGHHYVWSNKEVAWTWDTIYPLEDRFLTVLAKLQSAAEESDLLETILKQAARELLLLESSDWQFVISTGGAIDYSKERFDEHAAFLSHLLDMAERYVTGEGLSDEDGELLQRSLVKDRPFEHIDLGWWRPVTTN